MFVKILNYVFLRLLNSNRLLCTKCKIKIVPHEGSYNYGNTYLIKTPYKSDRLVLLCAECNKRDNATRSAIYRRKNPPKIVEMKHPYKRLDGEYDPPGFSMSLADYATPEGKAMWAEAKRQREEREKNR